MYSLLSDCPVSVFVVVQDSTADGLVVKCFKKLEIEYVGQATSALPGILRLPRYLDITQAAPSVSPPSTNK